MRSHQCLPRAMARHISHYEYLLLDVVIAQQ